MQVNYHIDDVTLIHQIIKIII